MDQNMDTKTAPRNITVKVNGLPVTGRTEEWVSAILLVLSDEQKVKVLELVQNKVVAKPLPGHHVIHCETGHLGTHLQEIGGG